jgi:hypothetical protein
MDGAPAGLVAVLPFGPAAPVIGGLEIAVAWEPGAGPAAGRQQEANGMGTASNRPQAQPGAGSAAGRTGAPPAPAGVTNEPMLLEPGEAEVDAWAERERKRREGWLSGPTAEERAAWVQGERDRRLASLRPEPAPGTTGLVRRAQHSLREAQLAAEGAMSLVWKGLEAEGPVGYPAGLFRRWSRRGMEVLVRAGQEWEEEMAQPGRGPSRRVPSDDVAP